MNLTNWFNTRDGVTTDDVINSAEKTKNAVSAILETEDLPDWAFEHIEEILQKSTNLIDKHVN